MTVMRDGRHVRTFDGQRFRASHGIVARHDRPVGTDGDSPDLAVGKATFGIVAFDSSSKRLFVVNAAAVSVDVLDLSNPAAPLKVGTISSSGGNANSVAAFTEKLFEVAAADIPLL